MTGRFFDDGSDREAQWRAWFSTARQAKEPKRWLQALR
jgi:hypothetical protein